MSMATKKLDTLCLNYASQLPAFNIRVLHQWKIDLALVLQYPVIQIFCQKWETYEELIPKF